MPSLPTCRCLSCPAHGQVSTVPPRCGVYPSSTITDTQWKVLSGLLPPPGNTRGRGGRPEKHDRRRVLDAIFYLVRGGLAWRQLPAEFPPWPTVYGWFTRWRADDTWVRIHDMLRDRVRARQGRNRVPSAAIIDSQSVKAADTVARSSRGFDAGKKINGRKRHIVVDTGGLLLMVSVTLAGVQDRDGAHQLLALLREKFSTITHIWADGGYAGRLITWAGDVLKMMVEVVKRSDTAKGFVVLHRRWVVERTFGWLLGYRRCVRDYERLPATHETITYIAMIMLMSRRLARNTPPP